jgi:hypothetical protein
MSDLPMKNQPPQTLRVARDSDAPIRRVRTYPVLELDDAGAARKERTQLLDDAHNRASGAASTAAGIVGCAILLAGTMIAILPLERWQSLVTWGPPALASERARLLVASFIGICGLSFLRSRPIQVVVSSVMFALATVVCDRLLEHRISGLIWAWTGFDLARYLLPLAAAAFGFFVHAHPRGDPPTLRGALSLSLVSLAALGVADDWYEWDWLLERLGPAGSDIAAAWQEPITWATVLILVAIGVAASRHRPVHLLNALVLAALAYHCIQSGLVETRVFPELARGDVVPALDSTSYKNVEAWKWVAAAELFGLGVILLHQALGLGALCVGFAMSWMVGGLAVCNSVERLGAIRSFLDPDLMSGYSTQSNTTPNGRRPTPLFNWGLPLGGEKSGAATAAPGGSTNTANRSPAGPGNTRASRVSPKELAEARQRAVDSTQKAAVRAIVPAIWVYLIAVLAGLIAAAGLQLLMPTTGIRIGTIVLLVLGFGVALTALCIAWPRDETFGWQKWAAAFRYSDHSAHAVWVTFLGSTALASVWALGLAARRSLWVHIASAAILLGTAMTIAATSALIEFGGFGNLPAWVYVVIAAGQSSLAWVLLTHQNLAGRRIPDSASPLRPAVSTQ